METQLEQIAVKSVNQLLKSVVREIRTPPICGSRGRATASGDPVGGEKSSSLPRPPKLSKQFNPLAGIV